MVPADGRRHVNESFEQFGLFQVGRRVVATLKLVARQLIARFQFRHDHTLIAFVEIARLTIVADASKEYKQPPSAVAITSV